MQETTPQKLDTCASDLVLATGDRSGGKFRGILVPKELINPEFELGRDPREAAVLEVARDQQFTNEPYGPVAAFIQQNDRIRQGGYAWTVINREDNPADHAVKYTCVKVVDGKDT